MQTPAGYAFSKEAWGQLSKDQRDQARQALAQLAESRKQNPIAFYLPHPKQVEFHDSSSSIKLFLGGNRSGRRMRGSLTI
jgi:hypothetical protein